MKAIAPDIDKNGIPTNSVVPPERMTSVVQPVERQSPAETEPVFEQPSNSASEASATSFAQDMIDRQEIYADAAKPSRKKGIILICLGVLMLIIAAIFCITSLFSQPSFVKMTQLTQYEVPDGILQEGPLDSATDVVYIYDLAADDVPYAVESHAVSDGIFGNQDLYESWDGETSFSEATREDTVEGDASNYRKIVVHLPAEAKGFVAGADDYENSK